MTFQAPPPPGVLIEADALINGDRLREYGDPKLGFENVACQWNTYIFQRYGLDIALTAEDVCWMMADLKKVRNMHTKKPDNIRDAAGYLGLIEKVAPWKK